MSLFIAFAIIALLGLMALVRLAPTDPATWHIDLETDRPAVMPYTLMPPDTDVVRPLTGGAYADLFSTPEAASAMLEKLDAIAMATPRTTRLAGSVADGRITWETRSALWGFPDYTTAQITASGLTIYARLRFGREDMGVNAARLRSWLGQMQ